MTQSNTQHSLVQRIQEAEDTLRRHLDDLGHRPLRWLVPDHPVRTKNLEKIAGHLQSILVHFESNDQPRTDAEIENPSLVSLLDQVQNPSRLSFDGAWEIADLLELESLRLADDSHLYILLKAQQAIDPDDANSWGRHFQRDYLQALLAGYAEGSSGEKHLPVEARVALEYLQQSKIDEYRRDRAKAKLRGIYLIVMAGLLALFVFGWCLVFVRARQSAASPSATASASAAQMKELLFIVALAGAAGSVLSRAIKLGKQPLHGDVRSKTSEPPLGIRTLLSGWKAFLAQPVIGATAAITLFFVQSAGLVQLGPSKDLGPAGFGLFGFLAGFSEPFFLGVLDKVSGQGGDS